jgi:flagellar basal-body rod modification protein FlgD
MISVSSIQTGANAAAAASDTPSRLPQKTLGQQDFMKLLAVQFQMQDPMKPMEDTAFIAQTAQFTALENSTAMTSELTRLREEQQRVVANSYLGHNVTVELADGTSASGAVSAVVNEASGPKLVIKGEKHALSAVLRVEPGLVSAPANPPANPPANARA